MYRAIRVAFFFALAYCILYAALNSLENSNASLVVRTKDRDHISSERNISHCRTPGED